MTDSSDTGGDPLDDRQGGDALDDRQGGDPFGGESADHDLGPDIPSAPSEQAVETPAVGAPDLESAEVDTALRTLFWKVVLLYKVSILGVTVGGLLVVFDRGPAVGPELLAGGLVLLAYTLYATKRAKDRIDADEFHGSGDSPGNSPDDANEPDNRQGDDP